MNKTFGVLAHVDAGKTTFCEQLLYHTNVTGKRGRVDHKDAFMDSHQIEKERGITVFSDQAHFVFGEDSYYLLDTPGHVDFSGEMERVLSVLDYAIVIVSAVEGVQGHTRRIWELLEDYRIPVFLFVNKIDRVGADYNRVLEELRTKLSTNIIDARSLIVDTKTSVIASIDEKLIEEIASQNEALMEYYFEHGFESTRFGKQLINSVNDRRLFLCMEGSALNDEGVTSFFDVFHMLTSTQYDSNAVDKHESLLDASYVKSEDKALAKVYKIRYDKGERWTFIKILAGQLSVRDEVTYCHNDKKEQIKEKISEIRVYNGARYTSVVTALAGQICALKGITSLLPLHGKIVPSLKAKVEYEAKTPIQEILSTFRILEAEEPLLSVNYEESIKQLEIMIMGPIQLEVIKELVRERFGYNVSFSRPEVLYRETIGQPVKGYGHYEPLRHYAEVALLLEPTERGSGISFCSNCHVDTLSLNYQRLIESHVFEKKHKGILLGAPLTDVKITLIDGRAHLKHTEGGDFREATYRAIRQGLEKAVNIVLEPYYRFVISVEPDLLGRVMADITKYSGTFLPPSIGVSSAEVIGRGPVATFMDYSMELAAFSKGKGSIAFYFEGYDSCHNQEEVTARIAYDKGADVTNTSASVFCAKGAGFLVTWEEAENYMHTLK